MNSFAGHCHIDRALLNNARLTSSSCLFVCINVGNIELPKAINIGEMEWSELIQTESIGKGCVG